jgi:hypothetical protein
MAVSRNVTRYVDPWEIENRPNPVMFSHLNRDLDPKQFSCEEDVEDTLGLALLPVPETARGIDVSGPSQQFELENKNEMLERALVLDAGVSLDRECEKKFECSECSMSFPTAGLRRWGLCLPLAAWDVPLTRIVNTTIESTSAASRVRSAVQAFILTPTFCGTNEQCTKIF